MNTARTTGLTISGTTAVDGFPVSRTVQVVASGDKSICYSAVSDATTGEYSVTVASARSDYLVILMDTNYGSMFGMSSSNYGQTDISPINGVGVVRPSVPNGFKYETTGMTGNSSTNSSEPVWPTTVGEEVGFSGRTFVCKTLLPIEVIGPIHVAGGA